MNLKSIEYFLRTVEEMNITRAADRLFISQQALSSHIKRLEDEYHVRLFERRPCLHLTPEGEEMAFYGRQLLEAESKMRAAFSDISQDCRATLKVGISRLRGNVFFPLIWKFYHPSHPNISIELVDGNSKKLDELLQAGKIDLYVGIDIPSSPNQQRIELATEKIQCCFTENLLRQYYPDTCDELMAGFQHGVDLTKIVRLPFLTLRPGNRLRKGVDQFFSRFLKPHLMLECDQQGLIYEMSKNGDGAGLLSPVIFYQHMHDRQDGSTPLHVFPILNDISYNTLYMVYRSDYRLPQYAMDFIGDASMVFRSYSRSIDLHFTKQAVIFQSPGFH